MLEKLIEEGKLLESEVQFDEYDLKYFSSINFERWAAKSILYLENYYPVLLEKAKNQYKNINTNTNYEYYLSQLGSLEAIKQYKDEEREANELPF